MVKKSVHNSHQSKVSLSTRHMYNFKVDVSILTGILWCIADIAGEDSTVITL